MSGVQKTPKSVPGGGYFAPYIYPYILIYTLIYPPTFTPMVLPQHNDGTMGVKAGGTGGGRGSSPPKNTVGIKNESRVFLGLKGVMGAVRHPSFRPGAGLADDVGKEASQKTSRVS